MTPQPSCAYARTHTPYIMDTAFPPQLFSLSQHRCSWSVTKAVGYCVTMWARVCENDIWGLEVSGVSMASSFPEPKPLFLGATPVLTDICHITFPGSHTVSGEVQYIWIVCVQAPLHNKCVTFDEITFCHVMYFAMSAQATKVTLYIVSLLNWTVPTDSELLTLGNATCSLLGY